MTHLIPTVVSAGAREYDALALLTGHVDTSMPENQPFESGANTDGSCQGFPVAEFPFAQQLPATSGEPQHMPLPLPQIARGTKESDPAEI